MIAIRNSVAIIKFSSYLKAKIKITLLFKIAKYSLLEVKFANP